jgi:hypothetical protein
MGFFPIPPVLDKDRMDILLQAVSRPAEMPEAVAVTVPEQSAQAPNTQAFLVWA